MVGFPEWAIPPSIEPFDLISLGPSKSSDQGPATINQSNYGVRIQTHPQIIPLYAEDREGPSGQ
jgi:hypothetical protein